MRFRTDRQRVDGLGSAKEGTGHFWTQRVTAIALVPLTLLFIFPFASALGTDFEAARAVLGGFDLDPASSKVANAVVRAARIFTAEDDGLAQDWPVGRIWMNPPYASGLVDKFALRFCQAIRDGSSGVVLVNNATETGWFQELLGVADAVCFPKGRVRFVDPEKGEAGAPLQGQAIIYCGPKPDAFRAAFCERGTVLCPQH